jgi:excisionase family DNA binding protein
MEKRLLIVKEVSERLRCDRLAVYKMIKSGKLRAVKVARKWLIPEEEIERLIGEGKEAEDEKAG